MESLAFLAPATLFMLSMTLTPGPNNVMLTASGANYGYWRTLPHIFGILIGCLVLFIAIALGLGLVFERYPIVQTLLKVLGSAYLLYLAWGAFHAGAQQIDGGHRVDALSGGAMYRRGIIMNVTNPKVSLFFLAFLPMFADEARGAIAWQIVIFGLVFQLATLLVFGGVALAAGRLGDWLRQRPGVQRAMNRIAGLVFVVLAASLLLAER